MKRRNRGITLIALIITIIVLLILAGVSVNLFSEQGILEHIKMSKFKSEFAEIQEKVELYIAENKIKEKNNENEDTNIVLPVIGELTANEKTTIKNEKMELEIKIKELTGKELEQVNLYWIDKNKIDSSRKENYIIDIDTKQIYQYEGKRIYGLIWHTIDGGIAPIVEDESDKIAAPIINLTGYEYAIFTESGIQFNGEATIQYEDREDINNYYSIDGGITWNEYTGPFQLIQNDVVMAKSVKKNNGKHIIATKQVSLANDALGLKAYDGDNSTYETKYGYLKVDSSVIGKELMVNWYSKYAQEHNYTISLIFKNSNKQTISEIKANYSEQKIFTVPEGTEWIWYETAGFRELYPDEYRVYEITALCKPVINNVKYYTVISDQEIQKGYNDITLKYFSTSMQRVYKIDDGEWTDYQDKTIRLEIGQTIYAKGIVNEEKETITSSYTAALPSDALGINAYDGNTSTYETKYGYIKVDSSMIGKEIKVNWFSKYAETHKWTISFIFKNANKQTISEIKANYTENRIMTIPEGTEWIWYETAGYRDLWPNEYRVYEITALCEPVINNVKYYSVITDQGIQKGYNEVTINYFSTSIQKVYKIDDGEWKNYQGETIRLEIGQTLYAKGITNEEKETITSTYTAVLPSDALGLKAYDGDNSTFETKYGYIKVDNSMIGRKIKVNWFSAYAQTNSITISFIFKNANKETISEVKANYAETRIITIPEGTEWIWYETAGYRDLWPDYYRVHEIEISNEPVISYVRNYPIITSEGIQKGYNEATISFFPTSVQKVYKINEGEWKNYEDKIVRLEIGQTLYAKGIDENGVETTISQYTATLPSDALGPNAYDGNDSTFETKYGYIKVDNSMLGKEIKVNWYSAYAQDHKYTISFIFKNANKQTISEIKANYTENRIMTISEETEWIWYETAGYRDLWPNEYRVYEITVVK